MKILLLMALITGCSVGPSRSVDELVVKDAEILKMIEYLKKDISDLGKEVAYLGTRSRIHEAKMDGTYIQDRKACQEYSNLTGLAFVNISYSAEKRSPDCQVKSAWTYEIVEVNMGEVYEFIAKNTELKEKSKVCPCPADK
jgi:hypothetical protein